MILDYLRHSDDGSIRIPPFHTGHLGFIPGTDVSVCLMVPYAKDESHCELYVSPFPAYIQTLCRLHCMMKDGPGVVNRLIDAISALEINIVKQESSGINHLKQHFVEMVLDWRTSQFQEFVETPAEVISRYDHLKYRIPIVDYRYVRLYEEIMCRCGDIIHIDDDYGIPLPVISIVPFRGGHTWNEMQKVTIESAERYNVKFNIPHGLLEQICTFTKHDRFLEQIIAPSEATEATGGDAAIQTRRADNKEKLPYIISSETSSRSLRVFFPRKEIEPSILHLGFVHRDLPGALSAITGVLAASGFNILTGLLRKTSWNQSGYEVVLEYQKEDLPPLVNNPSDYSKVFEWVRAKIEACNAPELADLERFNVQIGPPLYPKIQKGTGPARLKLANSSVTTLSSADSPIESREALLKTCLDRVLKQRVPRPQIEEIRINLLNDVKYRLSTRKPVIFMSYPTVARTHADLLKSKLAERFKNRFEITDYQTSDFEIVVDSVKERIRRCDYFIGIWHHEELLGHHQATISPWMPFEYGIALQADKKAVVIHSDKLPEPIWKRIDPGISQPIYNDLTFEKDMVRKVLDYCETHWLHPEVDEADQEGLDEQDNSGLQS